MMDIDIPRSVCRICGCHKLNTYHCAPELRRYIEINQILSRDTHLDQLIRPCECRGEFAFVHQVCLSNWIQTTRHRFCDICCFKYNIIHRNRTFYEWLTETKQLYNSWRLLCVILLIYYVSSIGMIVTHRVIHKDILDVFIMWTSHIWFIICSCVMIYSIFRAIIEFRRWRVMNRKVWVLKNESPQLESKDVPKDVLKSSGFGCSKAH